MIARQTDCDPEQLSALLTESLDGGQQAAVTRHLDHCSHCRARLEEMTADESWWSDARQTLRDLQSEPNTAFLATGTTATKLNGSSNCGRQLDSSPSEQHWVLRLLQPSDNPSALGEIDGMTIESVVGQGGMGVVLKAREHSLQRFLAIKLLSPMLAGSGAARQRFFREARAAAAIVHPNIVPIYAVSAERSLPYLLMPYVAGGNLQHALDTDGPLTIERSLSIGLQVAEGLAAAHRQGIVHRDIKPANLMLDEGGFRILITDFGLARALDDATLTASGLLAGTPQYMSPEQARGAAIDHRSDIYSLGSVLYAMATGRSPVRGESTLEILRRIGEESPKPITQINESYPAWYQRLVQFLMAPSVSERPQSTEQVADLIRASLAHARSPHQVPLPRELQPKKSSFWRRPRFLISAVCVMTAAVALIGSVWLIVRPIHSTSQAADRSPTQEVVPSVLSPNVEPWSSELTEQLLLTSEQELRRFRDELRTENRE